MKFIKALLIVTFFCIIIGVTTIFGFYQYVKPELPDVATLKDVQLQTPMQVYSRDGKLIAQFGEKRRIPLKLEDMPPHLLEAIIATEDSRFYSHYGFDPIGITRAAFAVLASGSAKQGASTITQQLARNFFLSNEKKIMRKIKEIFIAVHIEQLLTKQEILELYLNKIYLGYRSYGVGAAAHVYFGKEVNELTLGEVAIIAGLPKAPSTMNPIYSVDRATTRRNVVLARMLDEGYITKQEFEDAKAEVVISKYHGAEIKLQAPYVAEIARAWMVNKYGEEAAYTSGMNIYTTVDSKMQAAANKASIDNLLAYDERHGFRGAVKTVWEPKATPLNEDAMAKHLKKEPSYGELMPAIVTQVKGKTVTVNIKNNGTATIPWDGLKWARRFKTDKRQGSAPRRASDILSVGEKIYVRPLSEETKDDVTTIVWKLSQVPAANTAFVAMDPNDGAITSLVGGFNFVHNKFNRATQSVRQVGSSIKPFIYSAALYHGKTLASLITDAPINTWDESQGTAWRPKNSPPTYIGPARLRIGLAQSKNVMAVRVLRDVGLDETIDYLTRFGFKKDELPRSDTIALGAGSLSPVQMVQGFSVFANNGYYVEPYYIDHIESPYGDEVYKATPKLICQKECDHQNDENSPYAKKVISAQNAFLTKQMMYSNIWGGGVWSKGTGWNGTGWRAQVLKRRDIGGKTGTTNDSVDAWYNGYGPNVVATAWVGFDNPSHHLGSTSKNDNMPKDEMLTGGEAGGKTAIYAWVNFMKVALEGVPEENLRLPANIIKVKIDRETGLLSNKNDETSMWEYFAGGTEPTEYVKQDFQDTIYSSGDADGDGEEDESLF
ncbi:penicillin-binding protein 1A [Aliivibrio salmonicida]|uniref:Penicillin-binding protein 1A n=1 Tax=Aliivibrio salmonicida (strain LFI1238) TaxID=316275 RepID=B6EM36_ALISL|nr:penicillin-binding protein 1A [Aliivibrio salmonicida]AZL85818.1 penicillin-binding protein 1A [Aliivibrio salmonicida]CAQ80399.1 penicillin-binding protein 1A [Aliivibrio salmonicida LFI1238]